MYQLTLCVKDYGLSNGFAAKQIIDANHATRRISQRDHHQYCEMKCQKELMKRDHY